MAESRRPVFEPSRSTTGLAKSVGGSRPHSRLDRTRRSWSDNEEAMLLATLKELVARGWKSDNGFKSGCLAKIEESMRREFPMTDLKVTPHIQSKIHTWKKCYGALSQVLSRSGIGFNLHGDFKIDCNEAEWKEILKADPSVRFLRNKSWPYYDDWKLVFGKDRASGDDAVGAREAFHQTGSSPGQGNIGDESEYYVSPDPLFAEETQPDHVSPEVPSDTAFSSARESTQVTGRVSKKRKGEDALDRLVDVVAKMHDDTNNRLEYLANRIGYEFDLTKARKEVFQLIGVIPGLTLDQVFDASDIILQKVERLDFFMGLPDGARQAYMFRALEKFGAL